MISEHLAPRASEEPVGNPLYSQEAEKATLGAILINPDCLGEVAVLLQSSDFQIHRHGWIFKAAQHLSAREEPIDILTVNMELQRLGMAAEVGGPAYLTTLVNQVPSSLNAQTYARTVKDFSLRRGLLSAANQIAQLACDSKVGIDEMTTTALEVLQNRASSAASRRYVVRNAAFALESHAPIDYVVDTLVTSSSVNVVYGEPGTKKTYCLLSLAACMASGKPWLGFRTRQAPVLYIDEESGERRLAKRLGEILRGELCDASVPLYYVSLAGFKLQNGRDGMAVRSLINRYQAGLVVIDALADVMDGDENDKAVVQPVFSRLRKIAEDTGCAVLVIHHSNKNGGYRGSSAIKASVDLMIQVSSENGSPTIAFQSEKNRDGSSVKWAAEAVWEADRFYLRPTEYRPSERNNPLEEHVLRYLAGHKASLVKDITASVEPARREGLRTAVNRLAKNGMIVRTNAGKRGTKARFDLA